ncbi:MAG TPA: DUF3999 family protein [Dehalococcoidales bacterium]|nr:DUF3999 family protein [Dehalococcoidales bacterium]
MPRNRYLIALGLLLAAIVSISAGGFRALADFSLRDWQYGKTITLPDNLRQEGLVEINPDREVFAGSIYGLADLRVIADGNTETPYKLDVNRATSQRNSVQISISDKGYLPGQYNSFIADLGRTGVLHNEIEFQTLAANFRRTAIVETSNDRFTWAKITEQIVYDFTVKERNFTTRNTRIRYPDSTARYLRVKIIDDGTGSIEVGSATVFFVQETAAREVAWPATILDVSRDASQRTTLVRIDLGSPGVPSYRLAVSIPEVNFHRVVSLEASADRETWRNILGRSEIYAYDTPKFVGGSSEITYPETSLRYLRLIIYDEDSPPLTVKRADVWGLQPRLVFSANPERSYQLFYGNKEARQPSYDIEKVFPYLVTDELPKVTLGAQTANPGFVEKKPPLPPLSERLPWLLPAVIVVAVVMLAFLLYGIIRQVRKVLPPPPQ